MGMEKVSAKSNRVEVDPSLRETLISYKQHSGRGFSAMWREYARKISLYPP